MCPSLRVLNAADIEQALPMDQAIAAMKSAFASFSSGNTHVPLRTRIDIPGREAATLVMPALLDGEVIAVKTVSVFPENRERGMPTIHAAVLLIDKETGSPLSLLEGGTLTAIRTGAASGAATDLLAREDSRTVAIIGAGVQARRQLEAVCTVRAVDSVRVYAPHRDHVLAFIESMRGVGPVPDDITAAETPRDAVSGAEIICTATTSSVPVFDDRDVSPGVHINGIGSYLPTMQEVPSATVRRARVIVDDRRAALAEAGDLIVPIAAGVITRDHIHADLGEIVLGARLGRTDPVEITFFKSVGIAVQDAAAAAVALRNAESIGLGQRVAW